MSPRVRDGSGTSHLMSALCRSEERREREEWKGCNRHREEKQIN